MSPAFALHEVVTTQSYVYVLGIYYLFLAIHFFFSTNENKYSGHYHM